MAYYAKTNSTADKVLTVVPTIPEYEGPYTITENGEYATAGKKATENITVNITPSFNIHFSPDTPPEDTTAIWIKADKPSRYEITSDSITGTLFKSLGASVQRSYSQVCAVGTKIYIAGGTESARKFSIQIFDTIADTYTTTEDILSVSSSFGFVAVGKTLYVIGGYNADNVAVDTISTIDVDTMEVTQLETKLPQTVGGPSCGVIGDKIYIICTSDQSRDVYCLDTKTNLLETLSIQFPVYRSLPVCAVVNDRIYIIGGKDNGTYRSDTNTIYEFDTTNLTFNLWEHKIYARSKMGCAAVGDKICLIGGYYGVTSPHSYNYFEVLDTKTKTECYKLSKFPSTADYNYGWKWVVVGNNLYGFCSEAQPMYQRYSWLLPLRFLDGGEIMRIGYPGLSIRGDEIYSSSIKITCGIWNESGTFRTKKVAIYHPDTLQWVEVN